MSDYRRRRRSDESRESGGLPLVPLVLVVIFAGLLLGALLAHFFGGGPAQPSSVAVARPTPAFSAPPSDETLVPATPSPIQSTPKASPAAPTPRPSDTPAPTTSPSPAVHRTSSPQPASAVPSLAPSPSHRIVRSPASAPLVAVATPAVAPRVTAAVTAPPRVATAAPATPAPARDGSVRAESVVRSYLSAVADGNRALATSYLATGVPGEVFMDRSARIVSLASSQAASGYRVSADVVTANGEYALTFSVSPGTSGLQITDHYAIKVR